MSERMHPEDLRALMAASIYMTTSGTGHEESEDRQAALEETDALLAVLQKGELERYPTAFAYEAVCKAREKWQGRAEAAEVRVKEQDAIIEARNKSLDDAEVRVRELTTQVEALNHLDEYRVEALNHLDEYRVKQSATYAALCAALAERDDLQTRLKDAEAIPANWLGVSEKLREYETRITNDPPVPRWGIATVQKEETLNQVEEIARSCGMSPTWEMVDHYASRVAELEADTAAAFEAHKGTMRDLIDSGIRVAELEAWQTGVCALIQTASMDGQSILPHELTDAIYHP